MPTRPTSNPSRNTVNMSDQDYIVGLDLKTNKSGQDKLSGGMWYK